ncbi:MAG: DUF4358 domain-containing protein [Blautia sp.]|nr:DUF4358 domain-containing protein [Blautia sp.]MCM1199867.1 DUF4358 domain-containing protein [Bacteroides fragilis]
MAKKKIKTALAAGLILCSLAGCGESTPTGEMVNNSHVGKTVPALHELRAKVKEELGERYWPEISISEEELEQETGITREMYIEFLAEEPGAEANVDKLIIIRAKEDYVGAVEQALEDYRLRMIEENQKYPQNLCKVEASRMETIENYICFVQLGADTTIAAGRGKDEIISYCLEENERAVDILEKAILR